MPLQIRPDPLRIPADPYCCTNVAKDPYGSGVLRILKDFCPDPRPDPYGSAVLRILKDFCPDLRPDPYGSAVLRILKDFVRIHVRIRTDRPFSGS